NLHARHRPAADGVAHGPRDDLRRWDGELEVAAKKLLRLFEVAVADHRDWGDRPSHDSRLAVGDTRALDHELRTPLATDPHNSEATVGIRDDVVHPGAIVLGER